MRVVKYTFTFLGLNIKGGVSVPEDAPSGFINYAIIESVNGFWEKGGPGILNNIPPIKPR